MGQKARTSEHLNPPPKWTKIWWCTYPKMVPLNLTHSHSCYEFQPSKKLRVGNAEGKSASRGSFFRQTNRSSIIELDSMLQGAMEAEVANTDFFSRFEATTAGTQPQQAEQIGLRKLQLHHSPCQTVEHLLLDATAAACVRVEYVLRMRLQGLAAQGLLVMCAF